MTYRMIPRTPEHYATNLSYHKGTGRLEWAASAGQDVLIFKMPYGHRVEDPDELCRVLPSPEVLSGGFVEVLQNVWGRYVSASQKAAQGGLSIPKEAASYLILAVDRHDDEILVYQPQLEGMIKPICDVPLTLRIALAPKMSTYTEGFFWWKQEFEEETGYYAMIIQDPDPSLQDGDLYYCTKEFKIPMTKKLIKQGTVYIYTDQKPVLHSSREDIIIEG